MPKVPQYQRQIISTNMPDVRAQAPDASAYGGSVGAAMGQFGQAIVRAGDEVNSQLIEQQQKINTQKTLDLSAKFDSMLANDFHNGYFTLKGQDAFGMTKDASKHLDNKFKELVDSAENDVQKLALTQYALPRVQQYRKLMMEHEQQQVDAATDQAYNDQMTSSERMAVAARNNPDVFLTHMNTGLQALELKLRRKGMKQESIAAQGITYTSAITKNAVLADINEGNLDGAQKKLQTYADKLDPNDRADLQGKIRPIVENNELVQYVETLKKDPAYYTNGVFDATKAKADIEAKYGPNATKTIKVPGKGGLSWEQLKEVIGKNESGGNYDSLNNDSGARGKYQFMPATWRGAMGDAPMTPENQEKAFDAKYKSIYEKYGAAGVLVAVYAGDSNAERYIKGQDLIGDNGQPYSADSPQYSNGREYPSVRQYVINALGHDGLQAGDTTQTVSAYDARKFERAMGLLDAAAADSRREKNIRDSNELERVKNAIVGVTTDAERINIIQNSGLEPYQKDVLTKQIASQKVSDIGAMAALEKLAAQGVLTEQDVLSQARLLDQEKLMHYLGKAYSIGANRADKESADADKQWHAYIEEKGPYSNDKKKKEELLVNITGRLNAEGLKGYARYDRALALMKEEDKTKGSIIYYSLNNNSEYQQLTKDFDPKLVDLTVAGMKAAGQWTGSYRTVNIFLSQIGQDIQAGDTVAQEALDLLIRTNTAINPTTYANARTAVSQ